MGRDIPCDSADGNAAVLMMSDLTDGETTAWCGQCLPGVVLSMAAELNPGIAVSGGEEPIGLVPVEHDAVVVEGDDALTARCACGWVSDPTSDLQVAWQAATAHDAMYAAVAADTGEGVESTESAPVDG